MNGHARQDSSGPSQVTIALQATGASAAEACPPPQWEARTKAIVYTSFWQHQLLVESYLGTHGVALAVLRESMKPQEKAAALHAFQAITLPATQDQAVTCGKSYKLRAMQALWLRNWRMLRLIPRRTCQAGCDATVLGLPVAMPAMKVSLGVGWLLLT